MIKVEVLEDFNLKDFGKLKNLERNSGKSKEGKLYKGDTFECDEKMCEYLCGKNPLNKEVVQVVELKPTKVEPADAVENNAEAKVYKVNQKKPTKKKNGKK